MTNISDNRERIDKVSEKIWTCKIGGVTRGPLPSGSDLPMRVAIQQAFHGLTGEWPEFTFSGWSGTLTESERAVVEERPPRNVPVTLTNEPTKAVMDPQLLLDDDMEIAIDNLCWDYAGFVHSPAPELTGRERKYDIARNVLRLRIAQLKSESYAKGYDDCLGYANVR